jgi:hypothetical protein
VKSKSWEAIDVKLGSALEALARAEVVQNKSKGLILGIESEFQGDVGTGGTGEVTKDGVDSSEVVCKTSKKAKWQALGSFSTIPGHSHSSGPLRAAYSGRALSGHFFAASGVSPMQQSLQAATAMTQLRRASRATTWLTRHVQRSSTSRSEQAPTTTTEPQQRPRIHNNSHAYERESSFPVLKYSVA